MSLKDCNPEGLPEPPPLSVGALAALQSDASEGSALLDRCLRLLKEESIPEGMGMLLAGLQRHRAAAPFLWERFVHSTCAHHPIQKLLHRDPLTRRAFRAAPDALCAGPVLDLIYGERGKPRLRGRVSPLGQAIHGCVFESPGCKAIRNRRTLVASMIDQIAEVVLRPRILAIGCGHLREAEVCRAPGEHLLDEYLAVDTDPRALAVVERDYKRLGVHTMQASIQDLASGTLRIGHFDLIYACGVVDTLGAATAGCLARQLFGLLRPGGTLLLSSFVPDHPGAGYMEAFMGWRPAYRTADQMLDLAAPFATTAARAESSVFTEPEETLVFLTVQRY